MANGTNNLSQPIKQTNGNPEENSSHTEQIDGNDGGINIDSNQKRENAEESKNNDKQTNNSANEMSHIVTFSGEMTSLTFYKLTLFVIQDNDRQNQNVKFVRISHHKLYLLL